MRLPLLALPFALLAVPAAAQAQGCTGKPSDTRLFVNVSGVRNASGLIAVTLYADDRKRFLAKRGSLYVGRVPAQAGTTRVKCTGTKEYGGNGNSVDQAFGAYRDNTVGPHE